MTDTSDKIERYEKQFGIIAVEKGYISAEKLVEALKIQVEEEIRYNTHRLIGEILIDRGYVTAIQVQDVLGDIF